MTVPAVALGSRPAAPASAATPFTDAYARLTEAFPGLRIREPADGEEAPSEGGWVVAADLAAGGAALDAFLAWDNVQVLRDHGRQARPDVVAGLGLHRYAWPVCLLFTVPWFLDRRVPRAAAGDVSFQRALGLLTVRVRDFACLPGDPAATLPGARVVPDEEALRGELRDAVAAHMGPVLEGFGPRMRRGRRALWGMVTDEIVEGLWYVAQLLGEEHRAMAELETLLPGASAPYVGTAGFRELTGPGGEPLSTRDRAGCCLFYTVRPDASCVTCPRTCDADRVRRLGATPRG
ncbi:(2Fe-2S)-binding protein [Streptomyces sp. NPDC057445]|uniref:(2Fe-2S)-binding protein n=1 Tax=Streptomyces sp. NPDC057445 TaxID=3346136 RepID=UPI0036CEFE19